jgi:hypothetical protein
MADDTVYPGLTYATAEEAAASGYSSPAEANLFNWAKTAPIGTTYDLAANSNTPGNKGLTDTLIGYTDKGKAILQTNQPASMTNWRQTLNAVTGNYQDQLASLTDAGYSPQMARFLVGKQYGWDYVQSQEGGAGGAGGAGGVGGVGGGSGMGGAGGAGALNTTQKNALQLLNSVLGGYGIDPTGAVSNAILGLIQSNYDASTIQALIENPSAANSDDPNVKALAAAWNARFAGNVAREKAGLTPLSPSEYIATENAYKAVMARAGLDAAHMDPTKLANLIGTDVSPAEVNQRINAAMTAITAEDPFVVQSLNQQFNLTTGDLVGHLLDPATQASVIQNKVTAAQIGAEAARAGTDIASQNAYTLATQGVTQAQAQQGFQSIAQQLPTTQELASRYSAFTPAGGVGSALQTATFGARGTQTQAQAEAELQRLKTQEVSAFSGSSGAGKGSLGISDTSGLQ